MASHAVQAAVYTDFSALTRLKAAAADGGPEALRETARQFEALFINMMLSSMRATVPDDGGLLEGRHGALYQDLFDRQVSVDLARSGQFGIADLLVRQLAGATPPPGPPAPTAPPAAVRKAPASPAPAKPPPDDAGDASPAAFVRRVWPHAQSSARRLGVDPRILVAQAALESAWGRRVPRFADGRSSNNLFGIKADPRWPGERVVNATLEFADGVAVARRAAFRAYRSVADSFRDYADFLAANPRYGEALELTGNGAAFARALQRAGYATDPRYAAKIEAIAGGATLADALAGLDNRG
ncbi:MAG: flagellar assembly peptidoglycan hydrolase FlgJ [Pseudomonadota bacterium]|nr:flagellar assembly peptidoglycan hydrolase FlgJ [Pseudomonadota bacterium]